jgi:uncharacterized cofD-like protein
MGDSKQFWGKLRVRRYWLSPGLGIKRWLLLLGLGAALIGLGVVYFVLVLNQRGWLPSSVYDLVVLRFLPVNLRVLLPLLFGSGIILWAVYRLGARLVAPFRRSDEMIVESLYDFSKQNRGAHIVAIGGGTGMPSLLRGLREHTRNITAIVTVADDGGSSGRLRQEFGLLPPGDFRNNIAALARDEALMTQMLQYRFGGSDAGGQGELQGHAFGNLLLAALTGITGSFDEALLAAERVLALRGRVLPSTLAEVNLVAEIESEQNGTGSAVTQYVVGESAIPKAGGRIKRVSLDPINVRAYPPAVQALFRADLIVMGPGSLFTSILPNLLVADLAEALQHTRAKKIYICNLAIQPGETDNYSVADHVSAILQHVPTGCIDIVLANDNLAIPPDRGGGNTIYVLPTAPEQIKMITADLVDEARPWRHDSDKLARAIIGLLTEGR